MKGSISFACFPVTRERALLFDNFIVQRIFYFPSAVPERDKLQEHKPGWPTDTGPAKLRRCGAPAARAMKGRGIKDTSVQSTGRA